MSTLKDIWMYFYRCKAEYTADLCDELINLHEMTDLSFVVNVSIFSTGIHIEIQVLAVPFLCGKRHNCSLLSIGGSRFPCKLGQVFPDIINRTISTAISASPAFIHVFESVVF